jgi:hypothetical protein
LVTIVIVIVLALLFATAEILDWIGRLEIIEKKWPKVYAAMNSRLARLIALVFLIALIGHDIEKRGEVPEPPIVKIPTPPPPDIASPPQPAPSPERSRTNHPARGAKLGELTDGQRFLLKKKLSAYKGHSVLIVLVGPNPQARVVFEQLLDVFGGWKIEPLEIGAMGVAGTANPSGSYMTGADISGQLVKDAFSAFSSSGVDIPLVPNSIPQWQVIELVVVVKGDGS